MSLADVSGNRLTDRQHVMLTAGMGRVRVKDRTTPIDRLLGEIEWDDKEVKVAKLDVDSEGSRASSPMSCYDQTQRRANISSLTLRGEWGDIRWATALSRSMLRIAPKCRVTSTASTPNG